VVHWQAWQRSARLRLDSWRWPQLLLVLLL
jgi:hypothetical protein